MGKEKRLFLLAVMTVMMSTAGYGAVVKKDINDGKKHLNETEIIVNEGETGVRISNGTFTNVKDKGTIVVNDGTGVFVSASGNKTAIFNNKNTIEINGGKGIEIKVGTVNNEGRIEINNANNGIILKDKKSIFNNKNNIIIKSGATLQDDTHNAISILNGTFNNNGNIENHDRISLSGGKFINYGGNVNNKENSILNISAGSFVNNSNGMLTNNGTINLSGGKLDSESNSTIENKKIINISDGEFNNKNGSTFNNNGNAKLNISNGKLNNIGTLTNTGTINIQENGEFILKNSTANLENKNLISVTGVKKDNKGNIILDNNDKAIGTIGINQTNGTLTNTNGKIEAKEGATGIKISAGTFNNTDGIIKASNYAEIEKKNDKGEIKKVIVATSIGIEIADNSEVTNAGIIKSDQGAIGAEVTKGTFNNTGSIETTDKNSIGIDVATDGVSNNTGTITVGDGATGAKVTKQGKFTNKEGGEIFVNGEGAKGIYAYNLNNKFGKAENNGTISVGDTNTTAKKYATGMEAYGKNTEAINNKVIEVFGDDTNTTNAMVAKIAASAKIGYTFDKDKKIATKDFNGKVINGETGEISVSGKAANAMSVSGTIKVMITEGEHKGKYKNTGNTTPIVENRGTIKLNNKATGIKIDGKAIGINTGKISGTGIGVSVSDSLFINSGTIDVGKNGTAIGNKGILANEITDENKPAQDRILNNTVYLKNGSKITGKILGAEGIDVLGLGKGTYDNLDVSNYEAITVRDGDVKISNSTIGLEYNKGTESYLTEANQDMNIYDYGQEIKVNSKNEIEDEVKEIENKEVSGNLIMADTTLAINFKDSLTNEEIENPIINLGKDGTLTFEKGMTLVFDSSDGRKKFDIYDALGLDENNGKIELGGTVDEVLGKTAVWDYYIDSNGHLTAEKESYDNVISKSQLKDFANILDEQEIGNKGLGASITALETLKTQEAFTNAVTQMSGGVHGYIVDFAALNARTMTNTMRNRALTRDYMRKRPLNSWTQDVSYIDNNHRLGGLMNVDYTEKGVLGISENQILPNGRLGLVYGGSKGNAKFEGGQNGSSTLDGAYFGGYYNHKFNNKWSLNSNANFVYTHNKVTRNVNFADINENFKSAYPTYTVGMGSSLIYTVKDDLRNKAHFYAGVDVERIVVGNINENKDINPNNEKTGLAVKTTSYNARSYYSIVPSAGFMVQNTGYVFDRKYRIGADLNWETEIGNIKDGKRIKLTGLDKEYKVETSERENIFSYSLFGALDLTESLSVNARYTSMFSDEYNADMIGAGFEYKMDTMADNFFGTIAHKLENSRPFSDRWGGTFGFVMETDDSDDYTSYFGGNASSGDVATSMEYKPKLTLSLNDKKSNWSYYFEAYHKTNNMFGSRKSDERESHASRYHGEARWNDTYSKGTYGMSFGYRNENSDKSNYVTSYGVKERIKVGTHELRITPSFTYDLGRGFALGGKSAIVFMYKYEGDRAGQLDMNTESQIGITYNGFMPRWSMTMNFYREDTWYDHGNRKPIWNKQGNGIEGYNYGVPKRDQVNQLRPSITYYFGNGSSFSFDARVSLGNGSWANNLDGTKGNESYETRYGFNYYYPVTPGFTVNIGGTFLNTKTKNKDHSDVKYGNITKGYNFRPNIGFYYSF